MRSEKLHYIKGQFIMRRAIIFLSVCTLVITVGVGVIVALYVGLQAAFDAGLVAALILVTSYYAYSTSEIARHNRDSVKIANKTREDSARPIVIMGRIPGYPGIDEPEAGRMVIEPQGVINDEIWIENVGNGPALNLVFYRYVPNRTEKSSSYKGLISVSALGQGERYKLSLDSMFKYKTRVKQDLVIEYCDVFNNDWRSGLLLTYSTKRRLFIIKDFFYEKYSVVRLPN